MVSRDGSNLDPEAAAASDEANKTTPDNKKAAFKVDTNDKTDNAPSSPSHSIPTEKGGDSEPELIGTTQPDYMPPLDKTTSELQRRDANEAAMAYPSGLKLAIIMIGLQLAVLCVALDNTIIATAIPKITDEFEALSDVGWYGSAYLLTISASQLFFGRLYSISNVKWTFLFSLIIFEVGSLVCGVAPSSTALIIGRAIAGLGASGLFSGTFIIIAVTTPLEKRPVYISLVSAVYAIASVVGPLLGGVFTDYATWRWCFYINLPFGCITVVAVVFFLHLKPADSQPERSWRKTITQFDPLGTFVFMPCIICLLLALQWGGTKHAWDSAQIIALFVVFGVLLIAFAAVQVWVGDNATIPVRIARQRSMAFSSLFEFCLSASFFIMVYYIPIWFQAIRDESATHSGINTLPLTMSVVVGTIIGGIGTTIFGYYVPFMYASVVIGAIGAGLIYTWTVDISTGKAIGCQLLFGIGIGVGLQQPIIAAQTVLSAADVPTGTAIVIFAQHFGGALLVSTAQNTFINRLVSRIKDLPGINPTQVVNAGATQITSLTKDSTLLHAIKVAYNDGLTQTYLVSLILVCLAIIGNIGVEWRSVKSKPSRENTAQEDTASNTLIEA